MQQVAFAVNRRQSERAKPGSVDSTENYFGRVRFESANNPVTLLREVPRRKFASQTCHGPDPAMIFRKLSFKFDAAARRWHRMPIEVVIA